MQDDKNDGYGTLEWIFSQSEEGLFLAVAGEPKQKEVMAYFADRRAGIYDCKEHSGTYKFRDLKEWGDSLQEMETLLVFNFQYAMQHDEDYKRLNFSRDMLAGMRKNLIFFTTAWGDDSLASKACDFYSFLKMRILLDSGKGKPTDVHLMAEEKGRNIQEEIILDYAALCADLELRIEEPKLVLVRTEYLIEQARRARHRYLYYYAELYLVAAQRLGRKLFDTEHLEMAKIYQMRGELYEETEKYEKAEEMYKLALRIHENVLNREHPDALETRECIMRIYEKQGAYEKLRELEELAK